MPVIHLKTQVKSSLAGVRAGFNEQLFLALSPPFPVVRIHVFEGCEKGNRVQLSLNFGIFTQTWHGLVTESSTAEGQWYFIDEGVILPFPLKTWRHKHLVTETGQQNGSCIHDMIQYSTGNALLDILTYPAYFALFLYRKPIYKKLFSK
jgi:ligand-binding SRPBCC domain-containing protein